MHHVSHVDDVVADGVGRECTEDEAVSSCGRLDELHLVAFGVAHLEPRAARSALLHMRRHLPAFGGKIFAHALGALGHPRNVVEADSTPALGRQRQHFNVLRWAEGVAHALRILRIRQLHRADDRRVVVLGGRGIGGVDGDVREAGDLGPWRHGLRRGSGQRAAATRAVRSSLVCMASSSRFLEPDHDKSILGARNTGPAIGPRLAMLRLIEVRAIPVSKARPGQPMFCWVEEGLLGSSHPFARARKDGARVGPPSSGHNLRTAPASQSASGAAAWR